MSLISIVNSIHGMRYYCSMPWVDALGTLTHDRADGVQRARSNDAQQGLQRSCHVDWPEPSRLYHVRQRCLMSCYYYCYHYCKHFGSCPRQTSDPIQVQVHFES